MNFLEEEKLRKKVVIKTFVFLPVAVVTGMILANVAMEKGFPSIRQLLITVIASYIVTTVVWLLQSEDKQIDRERKLQKRLDHKSKMRRVIEGIGAIVVTYFIIKLVYPLL
ncbi:hypothetical protein [Shouchella lehensis]|uniref:Uncharacterized protein n=1 Tax=Shouchella lehensis TaxID=300825 RepID=A0A4Y7WLP2_9BACI|nr:hypothetical protein [Shouchella lehensis]MBG9783038.1 hypothetical protein [Shouchella lehensis]RQW22756.1 hypothetical protein EH196_02810 [Bacillus sp. C1-1]TES49606.1 hypothetical protein E2L03_09090 [Shouchella lehensis]